MLVEQIQKSLDDIIKLIDSSFESFSQDSFKKLKSAKSAKVLSGELGINEQMLTEFEEAIRQFYTFKDDPNRKKLAYFRISLWLETISKNLKIPFDIDEALSNEELAIKQVRALELIIRDLVSENLGGSENVVLRLQELFKQEIVEKWLKSADETGILSGTTFSELSNIFLDKNIFKSVEDIFNSSSIQLTKTTRDSLRYLLEDIRLIRNAIAHNKKISKIQIEALNEYYFVIAKLITASKASSINPLKYFDSESANIINFLKSLKEDNSIISGNLDDINRNIEVIKNLVDEGFKEISNKADEIKNDLKTGWVTKKYMVLFIIILILSIVVIIGFSMYNKRSINAKIQFQWQATNAFYQFNEMKKVYLILNSEKKEVYFNNTGLSELTNISANNLNSKLILQFDDEKIIQLDTPLLKRDEIIPIKLHIKKLERAMFKVRDAISGSPVNSASIFFDGLSGKTDNQGNCQIEIPLNKQSKYINIEVQAYGYSYYKLNNVLVNSEKQIEILLNK